MIHFREHTGPESSESSPMQPGRAALEPGRHLGIFHDIPQLGDGHGLGAVLMRGPGRGQAHLIWSDAMPKVLLEAFHFRAGFPQRAPP